MDVKVKKDNQIILESEISRFNFVDGNLSFSVNTSQLIDLPLVNGSVYEVEINGLDNQVINKQCVYISYTYQVFDNIYPNEDGTYTRELSCSENSLLFKALT